MGKFVKHALELVGCNTDPCVLHSEANDGDMALAVDLDGRADITIFGKFDGIAHKIGQDLPHPADIADEMLGEVLWIINNQLKIFALRIDR